MRWRARYLDPAQAAAVYDRVGRWQDTQGFYERDAVAGLVAAGRFGEAGSVLELGCGTGALAASLLSEHLPPGARYLGLDVSRQMVDLTRSRLRSWSDRADVALVDGRSPWPLGDDSCDRVVASYVLDLLSPSALDVVVAEAARVLRPGGLFAVAGLAPGPGGFAGIVSTGWSLLFRVDPHLTGGCRPVELGPHVPAGWRVLHDSIVTSWGVCSRVFVGMP